jgi:hypothetical protein
MLVNEGLPDLSARAAAKYDLESMTAAVLA